jgi:hypothetical protein
MKCTNPQTSNGKKCDGVMTAPAWMPVGKVECEKCGFRTDAPKESKPKADKETK